jgi:hypothetical protein
MEGLRERRLFAVLLALAFAIAWADTSALAQGRGKGRGEGGGRGAGAGKQGHCSWERCYNRCMELGGTHRIIISRGCQERCAKRGCTVTPPSGGNRHVVH